MKDINEKIRLVSTVAVCVLFVTVAFSSAVGKTPSNRNFELDNKENDDTSPGPSSSTSKLFRPLSLPEWFYKIFNYDWNYWSNPPHLYSIPSGNIGIGTDEPLSTLDIYDSDEPAEIRLASGLHGGSGTINFVNSGWLIRSGFATPPQSLGFRYGGDEVMTLKGKNVGIGTTEPQNALHVDGAINLDPIDEPEPPSTGFILYCDASDGKLKTMDEFGSITTLAVPRPPQQDIFKAGILGWGSNSNHNNPIVFRNISGKLLTILSYDESQTLYSISNPSTPDDWEIIYDIIHGTIDYNHPDGLYINGNQDEWYFALYPDNISVEDYTVVSNVRFDLPTGLLDGGIVFNYLDENHWYWGDLCLCTTPYFKLWKYENGSFIDASPYYNIPMVAGETYDLKIKVSNSEQEVRVYINNGAWNYIINL